MSTIPQVCAAIMRTVTTKAELAGRESGLVQRKRKLTGDKLAQILVFGWLNQAEATLEELSQTASTLGIKVSPQAMDQRFSPAAADFLERVLQAAVGEVISAASPAIAVFQRFKGVLVQDSSVVILPQESYTPPEIAEVKKFVAKGGKLLLNFISLVCQFCHFVGQRQTIPGM